MPPTTDDNDLRALFAAMREQEARQAPAFAPLWDEAVARAARRRRRRGWLRYAAAAALLAGLALSALLLLRQPRPAPSLAAWRSPTAGLLPTPAALPGATLPTSALLAPAPRLDAYVPATQVFWPGHTIQPDTTNAGSNERTR